MNDIVNLDVYNEGMQKSLADKTFFIHELFDGDGEKLDGPLLVFDYGCADGSLEEYVGLKNDEPLFFIGYDQSNEMISLANSKKLKNAQFFRDFEFANKIFDKFRQTHKTVLLLSSVLHEIIHYLNVEEFTQFMEWVHSKNFDYIAVRDMFKPKYFDLHSANDILIKEGVIAKWPNSILDVFKTNDKKIKKKMYEFDTVIKKNGRPAGIGMSSIYHFMLKYKYDDNWERECEEEYFIPAHFDFGEKYKKIYIHSFYLEHQFQNIKKDFGIDLPRIHTHKKIIFKLKQMSDQNHQGR